MENDNKSKTPSHAEKCNLEARDPVLSLPKELVDKLHSFVALTNNHLMTIPVQGDQILASAEIMNLAIELHKKLEEIKHGK